MIKLVCSDIDNTFLRKDPAGGNYVLAGLKAKGVLPMLATGRSVADVYSLFPESLSNTVIASLDGALVTVGGSVIVDRPVEKNILRAFWDSFQKSALAGCSLIFYTRDACYVTGDAAERALREGKTMAGRTNRISDIGGIPSEVYKISVYSDKERDFDYLFADWENYLNCVYRRGNWCEFVSAGTDKGLALSLIMEKFMFGKSEVLAFGDGENDFTMLEAAGCSYAMAGSPAEREGRGDFVTSDALRTIEELVLRR